jgi:excisionase family DNA binding protein
MPKEADFYTPGDAAKVLGLAELTVLGLLTSGQLEGHQDERARWWIPSNAIDAARHSKSPGHPVDSLARKTTATTPAIPDHRQAPLASNKTTQLGAVAGPSPRTPSADNTGQPTNESGWTTTGQAARALAVSPRTVRRLIDRGELEGRKVTEGIVEAWEVSIDSLYTLRDKRLSEGQVRRNVPRTSAQSHEAEDFSTDHVRDLTDRLVQLSSEVGELRGRLELTERAESTLQEERARLIGELEREREERRKAREENEHLRSELEAERSKGFWRRLFGGG